MTISTVTVLQISSEAGEVLPPEPEIGNTIGWSGENLYLSERFAVLHAAMKSRSRIEETRPVGNKST
jgi:hypothetical protein